MPFYRVTHNFVDYMFADCNELGILTKKLRIISIIYAIDAHHAPHTRAHTHSHTYARIIDIREENIYGAHTNALSYDTYMIFAKVSKYSSFYA